RGLLPPRPLPEPLVRRLPRGLARRPDRRRTDVPAAPARPALPREGPRGAARVLAGRRRARDRRAALPAGGARRGAPAALEARRALDRRPRSPHALAPAAPRLTLGPAPASAGPSAIVPTGSATLGHGDRGGDLGRRIARTGACRPLGRGSPREGGRRCPTPVSRVLLSVVSDGGDHFSR